MKKIVLIFIVIFMAGCLKSGASKNGAPFVESFTIDGIKKSFSENISFQEGKVIKIEINMKDNEGDEIFLKEVTVLNGKIEKSDTGYIYSIGEGLFTTDEIKIKTEDDKGNQAEITKNIKIIKIEITFMIYMAADNNLNGGESGEYREIKDMAKRDFEEIKNAAIDEDKIKVVIYGDFYDIFGDSVMKSGIYSKKGSEIINEVELSEANTGDKENLKYFINYAKEKYPARRFILGFWGHADGWHDDIYGSWNNPIEKAVGFDYSSERDSLDLWEVETAVKESLIPKIDIMYFDVCSMGGIEVGYQFKDIADYIAFSPELTPGTGGDYKNILETISKNYAEETKNIAVKIQEENLKSYMKDGSHYFENKRGLEEVAYSVVDQSKVGQLIDKFNKIAYSLKDNTYLLQDITGVQTYAKSGITDETDYVDIGHLFKLIKESVTYEGLKNDIDDFLDFLQNEYVVSSIYQNADSNEDGVPEYILNNTTGLYIYINMDGKTAISNYQYASRFAKDTYWIDVLKNYR